MTSLVILKGLSEAINRTMTENTMAEAIRRIQWPKDNGQNY